MTLETFWIRERRGRNTTVNNRNEWIAITIDFLTFIPFPVLTTFYTYMFYRFVDIVGFSCSMVVGIVGHSRNAGGTTVSGVHCRGKSEHWWKPIATGMLENPMPFTKWLSVQSFEILSGLWKRRFVLERHATKSCFIIRDLRGTEELRIYVWPRNGSQNSPWTW